MLRVKCVDQGHSKYYHSVLRQCKYDVSACCVPEADAAVVQIFMNVQKVKIKARAGINSSEVHCVFNVCIHHHISTYS